MSGPGAEARQRDWLTSQGLRQREYHGQGRWLVIGAWARINRGYGCGLVNAWCPMDSRLCLLSDYGGSVPKRAKGMTLRDGALRIDRIALVAGACIRGRSGARNGEPDRGQESHGVNRGVRAVELDGRGSPRRRFSSRWTVRATRSAELMRFSLPRATESGVPRRARLRGGCQTQRLYLRFSLCLCASVVRA